MRSFAGTAILYFLWMWIVAELFFTGTALSVSAGLCLSLLQFLDAYTFRLPLAKQETHRQTVHASVCIVIALYLLFGVDFTNLQALSPLPFSPLWINGALAFFAFLAARKIHRG